MVRKPRTVLFLSGILLCMLFSACNNKNPEVPTPVIDLEATQKENTRRTQAAETLSVAMSQAAMDATLTASAPTATITRPATRTPTQTVTNTPFIGATDPTSTTLTPQITAPIIPSVTEHILDWQCNLIRTTPAYKAELRRGESFETHWQILNSGTQIWYNRYVKAIFRNGMEMHTNDGDMAILDVVNPGDVLELAVPMKAPLEAGEYSSVWVLTLKGDPFCWFTVDIIVN